MGFFPVHTWRHLMESKSSCWIKNLVRLYDGENSKDIGEREQGRSIDGEWSIDEELKQYAITLNGMTTVYSVVQPENSHTCLLIKAI